MKNSIYALLTLLIIISTVLLLLKFKNNIELSCKNKIEIEVKKKNNINEILISVLDIYNRSIGEKLDPSIKIFDSEGVTFSIGDFLNNEYYLIYIISDKYCFSCVESGAISLNNYIKKSPNAQYNVLVIGYFNNKVSFNNYLNMLNINDNISIFGLGYEIKLPANDFNAPYFLIINDKKEVVSCFYPEKSLPELTDYYLNGINHLIK